MAISQEGKAQPTQQTFADAHCATAAAVGLRFDANENAKMPCRNFLPVMWLVQQLD